MLSNSGRGDFVLCQITSKSYGDPRSVLITSSGFKQGSLRIDSYVRPGKLFTANEKLVVKTIGDLQNDLFNEILDAVVSLVSISRR